jgi:hypothetical protein
MRQIRVPICLHRIALDKIENAIEHIDDDGQDDDYPYHPFLPLVLWTHDPKHEGLDSSLPGSKGHDFGGSKEEIDLESV